MPDDVDSAGSQGLDSVVMRLWFFCLRHDDSELVGEGGDRSCETVKRSLVRQRAVRVTVPVREGRVYACVRV